MAVRETPAEHIERLLKSHDPVAASRWENCHTMWSEVRGKVNLAEPGFQSGITYLRANYITNKLLN